MKNFELFPHFRVGPFLIIILFFGNMGSNKCMARQQQNAQWSFYLAFEDATEAKDSLWFLFNTAATYPYSISELYGETQIETETINFQIWFYHPLSYVNGNPTIRRYDTFMGNIMDEYAAFSTEFFATNFVLPITATWDSSLFTSEVL